MRLDAPLAITDRGIHYQSHYDIGGGQRWSNSVSAASGGRWAGLPVPTACRHSYAQERMAELQASLSRRCRADHRQPGDEPLSARITGDLPTMRLFLLAVSLAALGALWWFLDDLLAMRAWVVMHRGAEPEITRGWLAVIAAWPVALAGVLLGGSGIFATGLADGTGRRSRPSAPPQAPAAAPLRAEQQAANAEQEARAALQTERDQVQQLRAKALEAIRQAEGLRQQALGDQATAREWVAQANTERARKPASEQRQRRLCS